MEIHKAINSVMNEVGYVKKSRSAGLTYSYAGESALIEALRPAMVEHGISVSVNKITNIQRERYTTSKGSEMQNTIVYGVVRFTHVDGSYVDVESAGEGSDTGDKSMNKAMTGMYKYALRQTFCIETGDDPDKYASEERKPATTKAAAPAKPAASRESTGKIPNAVISDSEWEAFTKLVELAQSKGVNVQSYNREKFTPDMLNKISTWMKSEIERKGK